MVICQLATRSPLARWRVVVWDDQALSLAELEVQRTIPLPEPSGSLLLGTGIPSLACARRSAGTHGESAKGESANGQVERAMRSAMLAQLLDWLAENQRAEVGEGRGEAPVE